jgi:hypothetical protein
MAHFELADDDSRKNNVEYLSCYPPIETLTCLPTSTIHLLTVNNSFKTEVRRNCFSEYFIDILPAFVKYKYTVKSEFFYSEGWKLNYHSRLHINT